MKRLLCCFLIFSFGVLCQTPAIVLHVASPVAIRASAGSTAKAALTIQVDAGYHVNSNKPNDPYLIPLQLTWSAGPLESSGVSFPRPEQGRYSFSAKPVSVFTGTFEIVTQFRIAVSAAPGPATVSGKLHYQACSDHSCLAPKTIDISLPVEILKASADAERPGSWTDPGTRLTWAAADNGVGVTRAQAAYYCGELTLGGHKDWVLPSIDELQGLVGATANDHGYHIRGPIALTGWQWSSSEGKALGEAWALDFGDGGRASVVTGDSGLNRALCVRR
jgi:hypothetical protein